jgi:serine/threonine protein kinase
MCKENGVKCEAWITLESVGITAEGCLRNSKWIESVLVPTHHSIFDPLLYVDLPDRKLRCTMSVAQGKFGCIDLGVHETIDDSEEVYIKRPLLSGMSLLEEACLQILVWKSLANIGFPTGAPKPVSVFRLRDNSICFAMSQIKGAITLDKYLEQIPPENLTVVIVDCLLQLCTMIWHLDYRIGINHRDLKPSNFLVLSHAPIVKIINVENEILEIESRVSLTFIDFGFSCLGSTKTNISDISLSTVYSKADPCPKEGRDIYLFLSFLYIDYYDSLHPDIRQLLEKWLEIPGSNICHFMRRGKEYAKQWMYFLTGSEVIRRFNSCPINIIKDLQEFINYS